MNPPPPTRVLIADDDVLAVAITRSMLESIGCVVVGSTSDGEQAVQMAQELRPDVILMDVLMPGMDGLESAGRINQVCPTPVVLLSACETSELIAQAAQAGIGAYLTKPSNARELERAIAIAQARFADLCELRRLNAALQSEVEQRQQAEVALRESEERYRRIVELANEGVCTLDSNLCITFVNPKFLEMLGYIPAEMIGRPIHFFMSEDELLDHQAQMTACRQGLPGDYERKFRRKDGGLCWMQVSATALQDEHGGFVGSFALFTDITARKRVEQAFQQHAAQLALLNEVGRKIAAVLDPELLFEQTVQLVQSSFGYHHVAIFMLDRERGAMVMRARAGNFANLFPVDHHLALGQGMVGWVGANGQALLANDVEQEPRFITLYPGIVPTRAELSVPIQIAGEILGVLDAQSPQVNPFSENDVMVLQTLADQIAIAIENARLYQAVRQELAERQQAEQALHESEEKFRSLYNTTNEGISLHEVIYDQNGKAVDYRILDINPMYTKLTGIERSRAVGAQVSQIYGASDLLRLNDFIQVAETGEGISFENYYAPDDRYFRVNLFSLGQSRFAAMFTDITEIKRTERALKALVSGTAAVTGAAFFPSLVKHLAAALKVRYVQICELVDGGQHARILCLWSGEDYATPFEYDMAGTPCEDVSSQALRFYPHAVQQLFPQDALLAQLGVESYMGAPVFDSAGQPVGLLQVMHDHPMPDVENNKAILVVFAARVGAELERIRAEESIKASLAEKEVLLREIHHRVKNNLQVMSSLLNLQARKTPDPQIVVAFKESQSRIHAMALVHQELHRSKNLAQIDFGNYLHILISNLFYLYNADPAIQLKLEVDPVPLSVETGIPCGLIVNELISNALKYAFPVSSATSDHTGDRIDLPPEEIGVALHAKDRQVSLVVWDTGVGLPPGLDLKNPDTLGLQLVGILTEQLSGSLELDTSHGTTFKITFSR